MADSVEIKNLSDFFTEWFASRIKDACEEFYDRICVRGDGKPGVEVDGVRYPRLAVLDCEEFDGGAD